MTLRDTYLALIAFGLGSFVTFLIYLPGALLRFGLRDTIERLRNPRRKGIHEAPFASRAIVGFWAGIILLCSGIVLALVSLLYSQWFGP